MPMDRAACPWQAAAGLLRGSPRVRRRDGPRCRQRSTRQGWTRDASAPCRALTRTASIARVEYAVLHEAQAREKPLEPCGWARAGRRCRGQHRSDGAVARNAASPLLRPTRDASGALDGRQREESRQPAALAGQRAPRPPRPTVSRYDALPRCFLADHDECATSIQTRKSRITLGTHDRTSTSEPCDVHGVALIAPAPGTTPIHVLDRVFGA